MSGPGAWARRVVLTVPAVLAFLGTASAQVVLRGSEIALAEPVVSVDEQGVGVGDPAAPVVYSWDRVASLADARGTAYAEIADTLWRARTRLSRGDVVLAEPALERAFESYADKRGATTAMVAEGLVRARLWRGAGASAVGPWLVFVACGGQPMIARDAREAPGGYLEMPGLPVDRETGLIPDLPPIWIEGPASAAFAKSRLVGFPPSGESSPGDERAMAMGALYQAAARFENQLGGEMPELPPGAIGDRTVRLLALMVSARISDEPIRTGARKQLERELTSAAVKPWLEAWLRVAIARSLMRDESRESSLLAVAQLAHLPARLADAAPGLTGLALADMAIEMNQLGDAAGALQLRDELADLAPDHAALEMEPIRRWPRSRSGAAETGGGS
jgi:hypothetical protein